MRTFCTITVNLSEWESQQLDHFSQQQALTISEWVRLQIEQGASATA
jgi:hypothetical protein